MNKVLQYIDLPFKSDDADVDVDDVGAIVMTLWGATDDRLCDWFPVFCFGFFLGSLSLFQNISQHITLAVFLVFSSSIFVARFVAHTC